MVTPPSAIARPEIGEDITLALQALVADDRDGVVIVGRDGHIEEANDRVGEILGLPTSRIRGEPFDRFFRTDTPEEVARCFASVTSGEPFLEVTRLHAPDGRSDHVEVRARRMEDGRILAVLRDASDLRRHRRALRLVSEALSVGSGQAFFEALVTALVRALPIDFAFVGEMVEAVVPRLEVRALAGVDGVESCGGHDLAGAPSQVVLSENRAVFTQTIQEDFPDDTSLIGRGVHTYHAIPLTAEDGTRLGILGVLNRERVAQDALTTSMLELASSRVVAEIRRRRSDAELHRAADDLRRQNDMLRLLRAVPEATNDGASFVEAAGVALAEITRSSIFDHGRLRLLGSDAGSGPSSAPRHDTRVTSEDTPYRSPFDTDSALARRIVASRSPVWVGSLSTHDRSPGEGSRRDEEDGPAGVFLPIRFENETVAVLELFAGERGQRDDTLLEVLSQVSLQLVRPFEGEVSQRRMRAAELRAQEAQKLEAVGRLAGGIAHEYNNLLMTILGETELLLRGDELPAPLRTPLEEIRTSGRRAAGLTGQLVAFSRPDLPQHERVDVVRAIRGAEGMLREVLTESIALDTTGLDEAEGRFTRIGVGLLEQVVLSLVTNARDAMPDGGSIRIRASARRVAATRASGIPGAEPGEYVVVSVKDTGVGIPPEIRDAVFEPFFTTKAHGAGFGLSTCYGIVKSSGGFIEVNSEVGVGSELSVFLPLVDGDPADPADDTSGREPGPAPVHRGRILVVEDDDAVRSVTARILGVAGYEVATARGGEDVEAYVRTTDHGPDLLLTDCVLRGETGRDIDTMVRRSFPNVGTVFMSGYTDDVLVRQGIRREGEAFLAKPFTPERLVDAVERVLAEAPGHRARPGPNPNAPPFSPAAEEK